MTAPSVQVAVQAPSKCASVQDVGRGASAQLARFENGNCAGWLGSVQVCKQTAPLIGGGGFCIVEGLRILRTCS